MADEVRLIDANKFKQGIEVICKDEKARISAVTYFAIVGFIDKLPTIEIEPVKHGRWIPQGDDLWLCSNCKENIIYSMHKSDRTEKQRYCCRCGARMDGDSE